MTSKINKKNNEKKFYLELFILGFISCIIFMMVLSISGLWKYGSPVIESEVYAPGDWIGTDELELTQNSLILHIPGLSLSSYEPTGSMKPLFDDESNGIRIVPENQDQINVGDIITFGEEHIVHRVIEKGEDQEGIWFLTQGDNNTLSDDKIRFKEIKYVTIGILY